MKPLNDYQKMQVRSVLSDKSGFDLEEIQENTNLANDLGIDSFDFIEILMELENIFNIYIPDSKTEGIITVLDVYNCLINCN